MPIKIIEFRYLEPIIDWILYTDPIISFQLIPIFLLAFPVGKDEYVGFGGFAEHVVHHIGEVTVLEDGIDSLEDFFLVYDPFLTFTLWFCY